MTRVAARIALLRHGHTAWNRDGRIQGRTDEPLDEQARRHLSRLRLPESLTEASLLSSPLIRAIETARLVGAREPVIVPELIEMNWGKWEGCRGADLLEDPDSGYRHIEEWGWDYCPPGGETPRQVWTRLQCWLGRFRGSAVVVCHIGIMRVLLGRATGWNFEGTPSFKVKRDRLYRLEILEDGTLSYDHEPVRLIRTDGP